MERKSIALIVGNLDSGGISRVVQNEALMLHDDYDITIFCRNNTNNVKIDDISITELKPKHTFNLWNKLMDITKAKKFDYIHCHDVYTLPILSNAIYTHHGIVPFKYIDKKDYWGTALAHLCLKISRPKTIVAISEYTANLFKNHPHVVRIPNSVNTDVFKPITKVSADYPQLLYVGLRTKHKGTRFLAKAYENIKEKYPAASLLMVGIGEIYNNVMCVKVPNQVILAEYYNSCDIFIDSSYWHSFGLPIVEAMACGKPVITRAAYAQKEHINNSQAGTCFFRDDPQELVRRIEHVLDCYNIYKENALKYAQQFSFDKIKPLYLELFQ